MQSHPLSWLPVRPLFIIGILAIALSACEDSPPDSNGIDWDPAYRGTIVEATLLESWTMDQVDSLMTDLGLSFPINNGIDVYKLVYETIDPFGEPTVASGAVVVPTGASGPIPMAAYQHGTVILRDQVPSRQSYELTIGILFGATGYMVSMADYLGMGDSPGRHWYVHAHSQATAGIDMLRASRTHIQNMSMADNGQLFLFGYSQGGHACMAMHKELEERHASEFSITASAPMSGPYDLAGAQTDMLLLDEPYASPFYLPYLLFGYNEIYGWYDSPADYLKEPWATTLLPLFDGTHDSWEINAVMPDIPKSIIRDDVFDEFVNDQANSPFYGALVENSLLNWSPQSPMRMYYCTGDEQVLFENALNARDAFMDKGIDVPAINGETLSGAGSLDHGGCVEPVMLAAQLWFNSLAN
jgi:hypothetical protein